MAFILLGRDRSALSCVLCGLLASGLWPGAAVAADTEADRSGTTLRQNGDDHGKAHGATAAKHDAAGVAALDEIVVTGTKLGAANVVDVPMAMQAITGDALQQADASGIMSIAGQIPSLSVQTLGPGDNRYIIRGISSTGESTTGVYYGETDITQGNSNDGGGFLANIRLYDLNRVEVLRGPQGTLYGASSMAGTIRFIPNEPELRKDAGYISVEGSHTDHGSGNNYNANGMLNLPIVNGMLGLRLVGWNSYDSGYINQIRVGVGVSGTSNGVTAPKTPLGLLKGVNNDDVEGGRAVLRYQATEKLTVDADYTAQTETANGPSRFTPAGVTGWSVGAIPPVQGCDLCNTDVTQSPWRDSLKVYGVTVRWSTPIGLLTATDHQFNHDSIYSADSSSFTSLFGLPPDETFEPRELRQNSAEVRFATTFNMPVNFVVGVFREQNTQDLDVHNISTNALGLPNGPFSTSNSDDAYRFPGIGDTVFGRHDHRATSDVAGYGEATWKITDRLRLVAGARYFTEDLTGFQEITHPFGGFQAGVAELTPITDPREHFDRVTWKGNISYKFSDAALAYGTVATGFRSGGLNPYVEPFEPIPPAFAPDTLTNYEVGVKGRLFHNLVEYQIDGYTIHWGNIQEQETTADGAFSYQGNAGSAEVNGAEFELRARPTEYLRATVSGSYQNSYLTMGASPAQKALNPTLGLTGDQLPSVPHIQGNLILDYTRPVAGDWLASLGSAVTYRGSENAYFASNPFNLPLEAYTLVNVRAGAIYRKWTATLFVNNVTDKRAQVSAINAVGDPHALLTVQPRTVGITIMRRF